MKPGNPMEKKPHSPSLEKQKAPSDVAIDKILIEKESYTEIRDGLYSLDPQLEAEQKTLLAEIAELEAQLKSKKTPDNQNIKITPEMYASMSVSEKKNLQQKMMGEALEIMKKGVDRIVIHGGTTEFTEEHANSPFTKSLPEKERRWKAGEKATITQPDVDVRASLYLLHLLKDTDGNPALVTYNEGAYTESVPKGSKKIEDTKKGAVIIHIDTGGERFWVEKDGEITEVFIDHHNSERDWQTSATQIMAGILSINPEFKAMLDENPWLKKLISFTTNIDNLKYVDEKWDNGTKKFNENSFTNVWPKSLHSLASLMPFECLTQAIQEGRDPWNPYTEKEIVEGIEYTDIHRGKKIFNIGEKIDDQKKASKGVLAGVERARKYTKTIGLPEETPELGKIIYHNFPKIDDYKRKGKKITNKIDNGLGFIATKAVGCDTYVVFNKSKNSFFINSTTHDLQPVFERLQKLYPGTTLVRGVMIFAPKGEDVLKEIDEEEFLKAVGMKK